MISGVYFFITVVASLLIQTIVHRYFTVYGIGPNLLLLVTVTHGFFYGPLVGELMGFTLGLAADAFGASLFGLQALMLTLAGYLTGRLRRRVAAERPTGQLVIAMVVTMLYGFGVSTVGSWFEAGIKRASITSMIFSGVFNALLMPVVFFVLEWWGTMWPENREQLL